MHPYLIHSGHFYIPTFGALAALGLVLALTLSLRTAARVGLSPDAVWDAGWFAMVAAFVLSRLLLIATNFETFLHYPMLLIAVPSLTALGLLLTGIATAAWLWFKRIPLLAVLDAWAPCGTLVWAFLALGHFFAGTDPAMDSRWGVLMPGRSVPEHPVALYACVCAMALTYGLVRGLELRQAQGDLFCVGLAAVGLVQFVLCFIRMPDMEQVAPFAWLDPLQWVGLGMVVMALVVYLQPRPQVGGASVE